MSFPLNFVLEKWSKSVCLRILLCLLIIAWGSTRSHWWDQECMWTANSPMEGIKREGRNKEVETIHHLIAWIEQGSKWYAFPCLFLPSLFVCNVRLSCIACPSSCLPCLRWWWWSRMSVNLASSPWLPLRLPFLRTRGVSVFFSWSDSFLSLKEWGGNQYDSQSLSSIFCYVHLSMRIRIKLGDRAIISVVHVPFETISFSDFCRSHHHLRTLI